MKTIKIIDLLVKIANGELEDETKFKYNDDYFKYWKNSNSFDRYEDNTYTTVQYYNDNLYDLSMLNDEVEVIEEDKKIKKLKEYGLANDNKETMCEEFLIIKKNQ